MMAKQHFLKHFGKITALPIFILVMIFNYIEFDMTDNKNSVLINAIGLFLLIIVSYFVIIKFYRKHQKIILAYFIISLLIVQNLFIDLSYQILEKWNATENVDHSYNFLWIIVLPLALIFVFIWGFLFDKIKNTK